MYVTRSRHMRCGSKYSLLVHGAWVNECMKRASSCSFDISSHPHSRFILTPHPHTSSVYLPLASPSPLPPLSFSAPCFPLPSLLSLSFFFPLLPLLLSLTPPFFGSFPPLPLSSPLLPLFLPSLFPLPSLSLPSPSPIPPLSLPSPSPLPPLSLSSLSCPLATLLSLSSPFPLLVCVWAQVGGGTLLAHCYPDAKKVETAQKVNGWGPFFVSAV